MNKRTFTEKSARIISTLFVPPTFTLLLFIFLGFFFENVLSKKLIVIFSGATMGFVFPIITFLYLQKKGKIINIDATIKEERTTPYVAGIIFCIISAIILFLFQVNSVSISLWISYSINMLLIIIITKFWKISAHAVGVATAVALLTFVLGAVGLWLLLILFLVMWARVKLKVHSIAQVIAGSLVGFCLTYVELYILIKFVF